jgi:ribosome-associated protein
MLYDANPSMHPHAHPKNANTMPNLDFTLTGDFVELHNLLKITGLADSGGSAKQIVASGAVKVDGEVELRKTCKIRAGQVVLLGDTRIAVREAG